MGLSIKEKLQQMTKLSASNVFNCGTVRVGQTLLDLHLENLDNHNTEKRRMMEVDRVVWVTNRAAADAITITTPDVSKLSNAKLKILLLPLKLKEDGAMPTKKADMLLKYMEWKDRPSPGFEMVGMA